MIPQNPLEPDILPHLTFPPYEDLYEILVAPPPQVNLLFLQ